MFCVIHLSTVSSLESSPWGHGPCLPCVLLGHFCCRDKISGQNQGRGGRVHFHSQLSAAAHWNREGKAAGKWASSGIRQEGGGIAQELGVGKMRHLRSQGGRKMGYLRNQAGGRQNSSGVRWQEGRIAQESGRWDSGPHHILSQEQRVETHTGLALSQISALLPSPGSNPREWFHPQWAQVFPILTNVIKTSPPRHAHSPSRSIQSFTETLPR